MAGKKLAIYIIWWKMRCHFRSWDVKRAAPQNLYGLSKLMEYVAARVGVPMGELTVFAVSAHIYEE